MKHRVRLFGWLVVALSLALSSVGCRQAARMLVSDSLEVQVGQATSRSIEATYDLLPTSHPVTIWAKELVDNLADHSVHQRDFNDFGGYKVQVIQDDALVNAFAAPGGYLFFSTGLILAADSCAEVAGVVGHELAHVTQRHGIDRIADMVAVNLGASILGLNGDMLFSIAATLMESGFSRKQEREADLAGLDILVRAGYNPRGMIDLFNTLEEQGGGSFATLALFSSHPDNRDRQKTILRAVTDQYDRALLDTNERMDCQGTTDSFEELKNRLIPANQKLPHSK